MQLDSTSTMFVLSGVGEVATELDKNEIFTRT